MPQVPFDAISSYQAFHDGKVRMSTGMMTGKEILPSLPLIRVSSHKLSITYHGRGALHHLQTPSQLNPTAVLSMARQAIVLTLLTGAPVPSLLVPPSMTSFTSPSRECRRMELTLIRRHALRTTHALRPLSCKASYWRTTRRMQSTLFPSLLGRRPGRAAAMTCSTQPRIQGGWQSKL